MTQQKEPAFLEARRKLSHPAVSLLVYALGGIAFQCGGRTTTRLYTQGQRGRAAAAADELLPEDSGEVSASDPPLAGTW